MLLPNPTQERRAKLQRLFSAQGRGLLVLPSDKILAKKEDCGYCYSLWRWTRNIPRFTLRKTILSALDLKQPTGKTAKCFLESLYSELKLYILYMVNFASNGKKPAFNLSIVSVNSNYYLFWNRDTGVFIYFLNAFTLLLLKQDVQDKVC